MRGLQTHMTTSGFYVGSGDPDSSPHICMARASPMSHLPRPSVLELAVCTYRKSFWVLNWSHIAPVNHEGRTTDYYVPIREHGIFPVRSSDLSCVGAILSKQLLSMICQTCSNGSYLSSSFSYLLFQVTRGCKCWSLAVHR